MSQALYRKWRPRLWEQVIGQDHIIQTLRNAVRSGRVGHAYLFAGPRGTGKTTTARLLAKAVNCLEADTSKRPCDECAHCRAVNEGRFLDLIEIDAASNTSVDDVRDLREKINFSPTQGQFKVYIIDEVHMLSTAAFNALLKTLEEPPPHAKFILATTEVHKIPATVLSRCQRHEFRRVPVNEIAGLLRTKCKEEDLQVDEEALMLIARQATGSFRDAISLLDQLTSTGEAVTLAEAQEVLGTATNAAVVSLIEAVLGRDAAGGLEAIQRTLDGGSDPRQFARQVVDYLRALLLVRSNNAALIDATPEIRQLMAKQAARFEMPRLLETIRLFNAAASETRSSWQPGLGLELALAEAVAQLERAPAQAAYSPGAQNATVQSAPAASAPVHGAPAPTPPMQRGTAGAREQNDAPLEKQGQPRSAASAPAESPASAAVSASGDSGPGLAEIRNNWGRIRAEVKKRNGLTEAALNSNRTFTLKDGVLILGYQTDLVKKKMETDENLALLRQAIQAVLGVTFEVRCIVVGNKTTIDNEDLGVEGDGIVRTALDMGAKIVTKSKL
jgi:DNA polymerase III subunit gamma/tau